MSRSWLIGAAAVVAAAVVVAVVTSLTSSGSDATATAPPRTAPAFGAASTASPSAVPVVSMSRVTVTVTATTTITDRVTATDQATSHPASSISAPPTPPAPPARLTLSVSGVPVPGGVAVSAAVTTDGGGPVEVTARVLSSRGIQRLALTPGAAGGGDYYATVHTGAGAVTLTVSATAGGCPLHPRRSP